MSLMSWKCPHKFCCVNILYTTVTVGLIFIVIFLVVDRVALVSCLLSWYLFYSFQLYAAIAWEIVLLQFTNVYWKISGKIIIIIKRVLKDCEGIFYISFSLDQYNLRKEDNSETITREDFWNLSDLSFKPLSGHLKFDVPSNGKLDNKGSKIITIKTSGHEETSYTVVLSSCADGTKLPPMII